MQPAPFASSFEEAQRKRLPSVCFNAFFDASAAGAALRPTRGATEPAAKFPPELRDGLPPSLRSLLDWELPADTHTQSKKMRALL